MIEPYWPIRLMTRMLSYTNWFQEHTVLTHDRKFICRMKPILLRASALIFYCLHKKINDGIIPIAGMNNDLGIIMRT